MLCQMNQCQHTRVKVYSLHGGPKAIQCQDCGAIVGKDPTPLTAEEAMAKLRNRDDSGLPPSLTQYHE